MLKTSTSYTTKMKLVVINEWNRTHDIKLARAAVNDVPSLVSCYKWIQDAGCGSNNPNLSNRYDKRFKRKAIRTYYRLGRNVNKAAREVGVTPTTLWRWLRCYTSRS